MTTGDRPPLADVDTPASHAVVNAETVLPEPELGQVPGASEKPPAGGRRNNRKRRRKRRRPVYAAGVAANNPADQTLPASSNIPSPAGEPSRPWSNSTNSNARNGAPVYAALDLGTNNCRLLIAAPRDNGFRVVDAYSRIVRLGEGIGDSGRLAEPAMHRSIEALKVCSAKLAGRNVASARLIATDACRTAANGQEFVERVRRETGLTLEIISRETEARLAVAGCASLVDQQARGVILFDIGGGSSEIVWIDLATNFSKPRRKIVEHIRNWMSLPVGVVNVSERHGGRHVTPDLFETMVGEVVQMLASFPEVEALDQTVASGGVDMLGTSGTVTTLAGLHLQLPRYDRRRVDGIWLSGDRVAELVTELVAMDYPARVASPCIGRERADLVLAGCAILEAFRRRWPCERLRVADRGLREGVLVELMGDDKISRRRSRRGAGRRHHE